MSGRACLFFCLTFEVSVLKLSPCYTTEKPDNPQDMVVSENLGEPKSSKSRGLSMFIIIFPKATHPFGLFHVFGQNATRSQGP
jgi:hypothetical protein